MKYINSEKLVAELTKMQFTLNAAYRKPQSDNIVKAISLEYDDIISLIDSLQRGQQEVDLEKVVMIDNVIMNMTTEGYNNGYKTRPFYEEVLRRLNARKE